MYNAPFFATPANASIAFRLEQVKRYGNASEAQAASYDRNHPGYPYKSHGQWLKAAYGLIASIVLVTFNGAVCFVQRPFGLRQFIASYISVSPVPAMHFTQFCSKPIPA